jgi:signal transduction histidine kinase/PAS domain-containing protein
LKKITFGIGSHGSGSPLDQGRAAALAALAQAGKEPPALAILHGSEPLRAADLLRGAREVLGACPLVGLVAGASSQCSGSSCPPGAHLFLVASENLRAKVGVGTGGGWEQEVREALRDSYVASSLPGLPENAPERNLYQWYLYRQPSLVLALILSQPGESRSREGQVAAFLKHRLGGRTPILFYSLVADDSGPAALADGRVVRSGVVLAMVKTELKFSLERFHSFEPVGVKLFVTRAEGDRILECNGRPAIEAYGEALGIDAAAAGRAGDGLGPFSLFPLAHRSREGRFNLLLPEEVGADGSLRFSAAVESDRVLYPMKAVPSSDLWRPSPRRSSLLSRLDTFAASVVIRDASLRDLPEVLPIPGGETDVRRPVEIPCGRELKAYLSPGEAEDEAGHLLLAFASELDPYAVAAAENERLFREVLQLKDLHQKIFDSIGYGIAVVDPSRRILFCNHTYSAMVTGSPASLKDRTCPWSIDGAAVCSTCASEEAITKDAAVNREVVRLQEGKPRSYRLDTFPLRDAAGSVTAAVEVMRDVTAFKDLRFSLESEQRKMEAVIRGMGETLYIVNRRYDLQFFHRGAFPVEVKVGAEAGVRTCHKAIFRRDLPCPWCRMHETALSGSVERRVAHFQDESGGDRAYQVTFSSWGVGQGEEGAVCCLLVDITAQRRLEQQMVLSEKLNSLSILSAGMAHELNNPLGAINFNLEILKCRERDLEYREVIDSIRKDVLRINRIVGSLLSFSRSGSVATSGPVALTEAIEASLELFQVVIEHRRIEIRKSWAEGVPPVWGSMQDLQQVFINLIANAIDAMPSGGVIDIAVELDERSTRAAGIQIAVVYESATDLSFLRALVDVPGWEVRFFNGDEEAIDFLRQSPMLPPEVLILAYADANADRVGFFTTMVRECAPEAQVLLIADPDLGKRPPVEVPEVSGILLRPLDASQVLEQVRAVIAGLRTRQRRPAEVVVRFADTGPGIPPEIQERIFDPFFTTKDVRGTGLGLSVVHKILENHGASIRVGSSPGQGALFTMRFPQAQAAGLGSIFRMQQDTNLRRVVR